MELSEFRPGEESLMSAQVANNYVVKPLNMIFGLLVAPATAGTFQFELGKSCLNLDPLINWITQQITLHAGTNITITVGEDGTRTIAATGGGGTPALPESNGNYVLNITSGVATWKALTTEDSEIPVCDGDPVPVSKVTIT